MFASIIPALLALFLTADPPRNPDGTTPRKPHPLAPSLPETTREEEDRFDKIIDRFILADTGNLKGPETKTAMEEFHKLPPEAVFALIRGMNKAAAIDHSCPALVIGKKIAMQLRASRDIDLLQVARENIGAGVTTTRHGDAIKDLRLACARRMNAVVNEPKPVVRDRGR